MNKPRGRKVASDINQDQYFVPRDLIGILSSVSTDPIRDYDYEMNNV
jgi:hypothetical protein